MSRRARCSPVLQGIVLLVTALSSPLALGATAAAGEVAGAASGAGEGGDIGTRVRDLLATVATAESTDERLEAAAAVAELGPEAIPVLEDFLARTRRTSDEERRAVLAAISADVPDEDGRFARRHRGRKIEVRGGDDYDWLAELAALADPPVGIGEVMADVAAIRALAGTHAVEGATRIIAFAFTDTGLVYRDECGRYLRKMAPYSLPALIQASSGDHPPAMRRYAAYQLERLDRKVPAKVVDHASVDEDLEVAVLEAYGHSKPREAVGPILAATDDSSPRVRKAARDAWMAYITGPEPPPAPERKLKLAGGRLTEEPEPLWLTYRELAEVELRRTHEAVFGEKAPRRAGLVELSEKLFEHYDSRRREALERRYRDAADKAAIGDWAAATAAYDRILAEAPEHPERAAMAPAYLAHAVALERDGQWREAAAAYSKAHGLAPEADEAKAALAAHYYALGKALEADGKDGAALYRRAAELDPDRAEEIPEASDQPGNVTRRDGGSRRWMLYAGLAGCTGALIFLIVGFAIRRRDRTGAP